MERYLGQIENNLEKYGLLGKEYIYWFDESADRDYPFVRETNELIKKYAPKITTFITEHVKDHDISDVTDISCTIWDKLNHDKNTYTGKPVPSLRLEILRDGIEDYEYFVMLEKAVESASNKNKATISEAKKLLEIPQTIYTDEKTYSKNPQDMLEYRKKIAEAILKLK